MRRAGSDRCTAAPVRLKRGQKPGHHLGCRAVRSRTTCASIAIGQAKGRAAQALQHIPASSRPRAARRGGRDRHRGAVTSHDHRRSGNRAFATGSAARAPVEQNIRRSSNLRLRNAVAQPVACQSSAKSPAALRASNSASSRPRNPRPFASGRVMTRRTSADRGGRPWPPRSACPCPHPKGLRWRKTPHAAALGVKRSRRPAGAQTRPRAPSSWKMPRIAVPRARASSIKLQHNLAVRRRPDWPSARPAAAPGRGAQSRARCSRAAARRPKRWWATATTVRSGMFSRASRAEARARASSAGPPSGSSGSATTSIVGTRGTTRRNWLT